MEVGKIAINDENFSSKNQKNTSTNSANEQDVRIFKKHVADEHKDDVSTDLSDNSEDSVQDFGSLFRKLKLSDEKEQSQNQSNDTDSQENSQNILYLKNPKKESDVQDKKAFQSFAKLNLNKDFVINGASSNKTFSEDSKVNVPQLMEILPIEGVGVSTTEFSRTNISTTIDSKASETTGLQASNTSAQQIKDQIVDRILVSTASLNANQSVKVVFSPTVLAETEVNIQKLGQALQVQFVSSDVKSITFIQSNQLDLQGYLQSNLKQFEEVQVSLKEMDNELDQPKDGRSRNRNEYQSLEDDEDEQ